MLVLCFNGYCCDGVTKRLLPSEETGKKDQTKRVASPTSMGMVLFNFRSIKAEDAERRFGYNPNVFRSIHSE